jgi:hypothetical protein
MLTNIHNAPAEGNFCNEGEKATKPQLVMDYNHHICYVVKGERIAKVTPTAVAHSSGRKICSFFC